MGAWEDEAIFLGVLSVTRWKSRVRRNEGNGSEPQKKNNIAKENNLSGRTLFYLLSVQLGDKFRHDLGGSQQKFHLLLVRLD